MSAVRLDSKPRTPNEPLAVVKAPWQTGRFSIAFGPVHPLSSSPTAAFREPPRRQQSKWQGNVWQRNEYGKDSLAPISLPRQAKIRQNASCGGGDRLGSGPVSIILIADSTARAISSSLAATVVWPLSGAKRSIPDESGDAREWRSPAFLRC